MVIHSASDPRPRTTLCGDYFYNYFSRGLDILFDGQVISYKLNTYIMYSSGFNLGFFFSWNCWIIVLLLLQTHKIKKFVLHTNFPGHSDFNSYMKCNFVIYETESEYYWSKASLLDWRMGVEDLSYMFLFVVEGTRQPGSTSKNCITPSTKWEQVKVGSSF